MLLFRFSYSSITLLLTSFLLFAITDILLHLPPCLCYFSSSVGPGIYGLNDVYNNEGDDDDVDDVDCAHDDDDDKKYNKNNKQ